MQRYFVESEQITENTIIIKNDDVHHIKTVMRYREGSKLICVDGKGHDYLVEINKITTKAIHCKILEVNPSQGEPKVQMILAQALPKGDKWEWILQKGTELGVTQFLPFSSERTVVKIQAAKFEKKHSRWQRIVKEAAEQSRRGRIPKVLTPISWSHLLSMIRQEETALIAYENGGKPLQTCLDSSNKSKRILLIIGPEGGFSNREIREAIEAGAIPITLGSRILRTETASIVALSCILFASNELGG